MNLDNTLQMLAAQLRIDPGQLIEYAREDTVGGYHWNSLHARWPVGSIFEVEGKILYALVRSLKPSTIVEIGGLWGCSTAHMAAALKANGGGVITSVDSHALDAEHGGKIPDEYRNHVRLVSNDGEAYLNTLDDESVDFVFSDADHATETTRRIAVAAKAKLRSGGVFVEHDASHDWAILGDGNRVSADEGKAIRAGLDAAGLDYRVYLTEPSDCGFAVAQIKREKAYSVPIQQDGSSMDRAGHLPIIETEDSEPEKPKRTRRKRNPVTGKLE